jgi:hypothetical protein
MQDIKTLYSLVTEAIRKTEVFEDIHAPGLRSAYLDVSLLEECIASQLPASDDEGAIARRGAIAAAIDAHEFARAQELAARFSSDPDADDTLKADLSELKTEAERAGIFGSALNARSPLADGNISQNISLHEVSEDELRVLLKFLDTPALYVSRVALGVCLGIIPELLLSLRTLWNGSRVAGDPVIWLIVLATSTVVMSVCSVLGARHKSDIKNLVKHIRDRQRNSSHGARQFGEHAN